jgi:hypothetical protein
MISQSRLHSWRNEDVGVMKSSRSCTRAGNNPVIDSGVLMANVVISTKSACVRSEFQVLNGHSSMFRLEPDHATSIDRRKYAC